MYFKSAQHWGETTRNGLINQTSKGLPISQTVLKHKWLAQGLRPLGTPWEWCLVLHWLPLALWSKGMDAGKRMGEIYDFRDQTGILKGICWFYIHGFVKYIVQTFKPQIWLINIQTKAPFSLWDTGLYINLDCLVAYAMFFKDWKIDKQDVIFFRYLYLKPI